MNLRALVSLLALSLLLGMSTGCSSPPWKQTCTAEMKIKRVNARRGCYLDVTKGSKGTLEWACGGGRARVTMGEHTYTGTIKDDRVELSATTEYEFRDSCRWRSDQYITGSLKSGKLDFRYTEEPLPGQHRCARACKGKGRVTVKESKDDS